MTLFSIQSGEFIQLHGRRYRIGRRLDTGEFLIEPLDGHTGALAVQRAELETAFGNGELEFLLESWAKASAMSIPINRPADISQLPEKLQQITKRRLAYVTACRQVDDLKWNPAMIGPMLQTAAATVGDEKPPHPHTVRRWYHDYMTADGDVRALVPQFERRGGHERRLDSLVFTIIEAMIERYFLTPERHSGDHVHHMVIGEIDRLNATRAPGETLKYPSRRTVYSEIEKLDAYAVCVARHGKRAADRKFGQTGTRPRPSRPLERVEIDHTKSDLLVVDELTKLPIGRPWVTAAIDVYSRMVFGIHVGFTPPSFVSVMRCVRNGIVPKSALRQEFPEIENGWPVHGVPESIVCDNGKEFHSQAFEDAMQQLGTEIMFCSVMDPNQKAPIERFLGTINRGLLQHQPGSTFSDIFDRGDYDPKKNAVISFSMFRAVIMKWICDVYQVRFHRGLAGVPLKVYQRAILSAPPPALPRRIEELVVLFGRSEERALQHTGIEFQGLFYNAPELAVLRRHLKGRKAVFRVDEEDIGAVNVYDELNRSYIKVPCTEPDYSAGLTLWQHRVIRRHARSTAMGEQDISALARAKADIQAMVDSAWLKPSQTGHKQRMARWLGVGHGARIEVAQDVAPEAPAADSAPAESPLDIDSISDAEIMQHQGSDGWDIDPVSLQ